VLFKTYLIGHGKAVTFIIFLIKSTLLMKWLPFGLTNHQFHQRLRAFFVQNFGATAEMYLEKAAKKDVRTKNLYVKR
jgi:hypothetical protein